MLLAASIDAGAPRAILEVRQKEDFPDWEHPKNQLQKSSRLFPKIEASPDLTVHLSGFPRIVVESTRIQH